MTAEQILDMMITQTFANFYEGNLDKYITGDEDAPTKTTLIAELNDMMARYAQNYLKK